MWKRGLRDKFLNRYIVTTLLSKSNPLDVGWVSVEVGWASVRSARCASDEVSCGLRGSWNGPVGPCILGHKYQHQQHMFLWGGSPRKSKWHRSPRRVCVCGKRVLVTPAPAPAPMGATLSLPSGVDTETNVGCAMYARLLPIRGVNPIQLGAPPLDLMTPTNHPLYPNWG